MEVSGMDEIYEEEFEFPDLIKELTEGELSKSNNLYLFMGAQPIQIKEDVKNIPYIVVIDCKKPPSGRVALTSIQFGSEIISPASKFHLTWIPYIPRKLASFVEIPIQLHVLAWEGRKSALAKLTPEQIHKISLLLPYELIPQIFEETTLQQRLDKVKDVSFVYKASNGKNIDIVWDKECHVLAVDIDVIIEDEKLPEDENPKIKAALKEAFNQARDRVKEQYEAQKKELESLSSQDLAALREMKIYKFYPSHDNIDIRPFVDPFVNRYYGKAHFTFPKILNDIPKKNETDNNSKPVTVSSFSSLSTFSDPASFTSFTAPTIAANGFQPPVLDTTSHSNGFFFNSNSVSNNSVTGKNLDVDQWKCECCENVNQVSQNSCNVCSAKKPNLK